VLLVGKEVSREQIIDLLEKARNAQTMCELMLDMDSTGNRIPLQDRSRLIRIKLERREGINENP
jgi:hypothetical protein